MKTSGATRTLRVWRTKPPSFPRVSALSTLLVFVFILSSSSPSGAVSLLAVDAGWSATSTVPPAFFWGGGSVDGPFTFTSASPTSLRLTDDFCKGDRFRVFDGLVLVGETSAVEIDPVCTDPGEVEGVGPDAAFANPAYSSGSFRLGPGDHSITIEVIAFATPSQSGRGYIRVDSLPVATDDTYSTGEDTTLDTRVQELDSVLTNDTGVGLTAVLVAVAGPGSVTLNANGDFIYTPPANFHGTASFTYTATSASGESNVATVTITVTPVNDAPVAYPDAYDTNTNVALFVPAPGVLRNDTDVDGDALTAVQVTGPAHGTLALNVEGPGSFVYTPNDEFRGVDTFTYRADDGSDSRNSSSNVATVTIKVNNPADQTAKVTTFSETGEVTLTLTFNPTGTDTFVIRPIDFYKHWSCRVVSKVTGRALDPNSVHGAPGTTLQIDGDPAGGDLELIPAGVTKTFTARGDLFKVFPKLAEPSFTDDLVATCLSENSVTDPTRDATGACLDPDSCLPAPIRTYVSEAQQFEFSRAQGTTKVTDQCPELAGNTLSTGCPFADAIEVILNRLPLKDAVVRVFDLRAATGSPVTPDPSRFPRIYEDDKGRDAACVTRKLGLCVAGLPVRKNYLVIVKFTNPLTGAPDYAGVPESQFVRGIATTLLKISR